MKSPLLKFVLFFILGILLFHYLAIGFYASLSLLSLCFLGIIILKKYNQVILPILCVIFGGFVLTGYNQINRYQTISSNQLIIKALSIPERKGKTISYTAKDIISHQKLMVYVKSDYLKESILSGNYIITKNKAKNLAPSNTPFSFDYASYLSKKGIHYSIFIKEKNLKLSKNQGFYYSLTRFKESIDERLRVNFQNDKEYHFLKGIILGSQKEMEQETIDAFRNSGTVHILSVSGLHILLAAFMIELICRPLLKSKNLKWMYLFAVLAFVWGYACLAMLSAAAIRSAVMYSILSISKVVQRKSTGINAMALAMIIILTIEPTQIFQLGFQLSFSAIFGIFYLSNFWKELYQPKSKLTKYAYSGATAGLSAQAFTFPLIAYYFGTFPIYFLPANLIVIFLSDVLIKAMIIFLTLSYLPFQGLWDFLAKGISFLTEFIFTIVQWIANLPFANIQIYHFSIWKGTLLSFCFLISAYSLLKRNKNALKLSFISIGAFLMLNISETLTESRQILLLQDASLTEQIFIHPFKEVLFSKKDTKEQKPLTNFQKQKLLNIALRYHIPKNSIFYCSYKKNDYK